MKILKTTAHYSQQLLRSHPTKLFIFGDNLLRVGKGGQAAIRNEANAFGIPTKASPSMDPAAFFYDETISDHIGFVMDDLVDLRETAENPATYDAIVVPFTDKGEVSLGMGLACLPEKSPVTYSLISAYLNSLAREYGGWGTL